MGNSFTGLGLSRYEEKEFRAIAAWKKETPGVVSRLLGRVAEPVVMAADKVIPQALVEKALQLANSAGQGLAKPNERPGTQEDSGEDGAHATSLEGCDRSADKVQKQAMILATVEGGTTGLSGAAGLVVDVPALLTLALRTIHKIGFCYGFTARTKEDQDFVLGILSIASANSKEEKEAALQVLHALEDERLAAVRRTTLRNAAQGRYGKEYLILGMKSLAGQLGKNLTKRKLLESLPLVGAVVGAAVNASYMRDVAWAARRSFQERWLWENRRILDEME